jgi:lysophospholipase L1-like esterase
MIGVPTHIKGKAMTLTRWLFVPIPMLLALTVAPLSVAAAPSQKWVTSWAASVQGPYPIGRPQAQPDLSLAFPSDETGARDQTFRLIVRPDIWGRQTRLRLSNVFGAQPLTLDGVFVGIQLSGSALVTNTNRAATFEGRRAVTIAPGQSIWSDPVSLPFMHDGAAVELAGRKLAVSFHVVGKSGPMTWHAKAMTTSYLTLPGAGAKGQEEGEAAFPISTTSWYFLDAIDMLGPADARLVVALGDSITDGTLSTLNGDDRWTDVLSRRLHSVYGDHVAVVNAGIGGNQIVGPAEYSRQNPFHGGPSARQRLDRDVLSLSGVSTIIWFEGINDLGTNGNASVSSIESAMNEVVSRIRARIPSARIIAATLTSALGSATAAQGPSVNEKRKALNVFIRTTKLFDGIVDFDKVATDPQTEEIRAEFVPNSTVGGPGDKIHPNRFGYLTLGGAIDLDLLLPKPVKSVGP